MRVSAQVLMELKNASSILCNIILSTNRAIGDRAAIWQFQRNDERTFWTSPFPVGSMHSHLFHKLTLVRSAHARVWNGQESFCQISMRNCVCSVQRRVTRGSSYEHYGFTNFSQLYAPLKSARSWHGKYHVDDVFSQSSICIFYVLKNLWNDVLAFHFICSKERDYFSHGLQMLQSLRITVRDRLEPYMPIIKLLFVERPYTRVKHNSSQVICWHCLSPQLYAKKDQFLDEQKILFSLSIYLQFTSTKYNT